VRNSLERRAAYYQASRATNSHTKVPRYQGLSAALDILHTDADTGLREVDLLSGPPVPAVTARWLAHWFLSHKAFDFMRESSQAFDP
jgi:hypothetical protein